MIKQFFGNRPTTKMDIYLAAGAAVMAAIHFVSVKQQYKTEQEEKENAK
jgi:hypothetical protein